MTTRAVVPAFTLPALEVLCECKSVLAGEFETRLNWGKSNEMILVMLYSLYLLYRVLVHCPCAFVPLHSQYVHFSKVHNQIIVCKWCDVFCKMVDMFSVDISSAAYPGRGGLCSVVEKWTCYQFRMLVWIIFDHLQRNSRLILIYW